MIIRKYIATKTNREYNEFELVEFNSQVSVDELIIWGEGLIKKIDNTTVLLKHTNDTLIPDKFHILKIVTEDRKIHIRPVFNNQLGELITDDESSYFLNYSYKVSYV